MAIDYLLDIERKLDQGKELYACPSVNSGDWIFSGTVEEIRPKAQRAANSKKHELAIYRLVSAQDSMGQDGFLVVRKFLEPQKDGTPRMQWSLVDTKEASEMMRDVSQGPSPYFGAIVEETVKPGT
ncbi:MAG TPA: hypothetical protein PKA63_08800 [Oligoflexia bacterium]|nr:hypothetical protein [Oligoflexia bacterium]HMP48749.1 hypothetical protein [Oligoflexia bacterium]